MTSARRLTARLRRFVWCWQSRALSSASGRCSASSSVMPSRAKKTAHAAEQDRPDIVRRRQAWLDGQLDLDPEQLLFIDEIWASTSMARRHGRCARGERLRVGVPHGHWKTTTVVAGLRSSGIAAPFVLDGPINRISFETYVERVLVPELKPGDIVIMDNLSSHKRPRVREMIEAAGANLLFLPPYSPDPRVKPEGKLSTRSRTPSQNSRLICERQPSALSTASGTLSVASSTCSLPQNAATTSTPQDTMQNDRMLL